MDALDRRLQETSAVVERARTAEQFVLQVAVARFHVHEIKAGLLRGEAVAA